MKNILIILITASTLLIGCAPEATTDKNSSAVGNTPTEPEQLNITILLDLSDRVTQPMEPSQSERDIQIVDNLVNIFRNNMTEKGVFLSKDKIQILFKPAPSDPNINNIAKELSVDLSKLDSKGKKKVYDNISEDFNTNIREIYDLTLKSQNWPGCDVWRFFKNDVNDLCIEKGEEYRNILIIITDGYLFHEQSKDIIGKRSAYVTGLLLEREGLRKNPNWREKFDSEDYGLISSDETFENLDIMVLEVNPSKKHVNDEDILRAFIGKWFDEMKVGNYVIYNTDLPENTHKRIEKFFD